MKKVIHIVGIGLLILLYGVSVGLSLSDNPIGYELSSHEASQEEQFSAYTYHTQLHSLPSAPLLFSVQEQPNSSVDPYTMEYWGIIATLGITFYGLHKQYLFTQKKILVRYKKCNLFFPFHNFWWFIFKNLIFLKNQDN